MQDTVPLGLQIVHDRKDKHQTKLVQRLRHFQKQMAKKLNGRRRKNPHFLGQTFFVPIYDGELHNQSVIALLFFALLSSILLALLLVALMLFPVLLLLLL